MEGILPLMKPAGLTSHDCVFKIRKMIKMKKVGHTGTLDPDVTGVLPICIGRATKVAEYITDAGKSYEGEVTLGYTTTTEDASGETVAVKKVEDVFTRDTIINVLNTFLGEIEQTPPMYSAVKVNGKKLYEYARQGIEVERPSRKVTIYSIELLDERESFAGETISFRFRVACSKGTYIRTLAVMIGEKLGYPAHMSKLIRVQSSSFKLEDCFTFDDLESLLANGEFEKALYPLETGISYLPKLEISDTVAEKVKNGALLSITPSLVHIDGPIVAQTEQGEALAIYMKHPTKPHFLKPTKVLRNDQID